MELFESLHSALDRLREAPGIQHMRKRSFERRFATATQAHMFRGKFDSFEAALASAPRVKPHGYDNVESARLYLNKLRPQPNDYPAMFWLQNAVERGARSIADLGGSVGVKFFAFKRFIELPQDFEWRVVDVPAVVAEGRKFAAAKGADSRLCFDDDRSSIANCDVLYASGALQYLPYSLGELLSELPKKPFRIVINTTPIHEREEFFTLNSIGTAYCAYRVSARRNFIDSVLAQGYVLRDDWLNVGKRMDIAFCPDVSIPHYSGFCFERSGS